MSTNGFKKVGMVFQNPIIKYEIVYRDKVIWRKYFQVYKLINYLKFKYAGVGLPDMLDKSWVNDEKFEINDEFLQEIKIKITFQ